MVLPARGRTSGRPAGGQARLQSAQSETIRSIMSEDSPHLMHGLRRRSSRACSCSYCPPSSSSSPSPSSSSSCLHPCFLFYCSCSSCSSSSSRCYCCCTTVWGGRWREQTRASRSQNAAGAVQKDWLERVALFLLLLPFCSFALPLPALVPPTPPFTHCCLRAVQTHRTARARLRRSSRSPAARPARR